ncbi:MAG: transposase, partial [Planctomycetales bacterium]
MAVIFFETDIGEKASLRQIVVTKSQLPTRRQKMARNRKNENKRKQHCIQKTSLSEVRKKMKTLKRTDRLIFARMLQKGKVRKIISELGAKVRNRIYTPFVTLVAFLGQAVSDDGSCLQAVHRINRQRHKAGHALASVDTNSYCQARRRLPEELFRRLIAETAETIGQNEPKPWLWNNRRVVLVDGLTTRGPDTPANRAEYPQPSSQEPGLGFPQVRHLAAFSLGTAAVLDVQIGPLDGKKNGELSLYRKMMPIFRSEDIILGDAIFDNYVDMASLRKQGVDFVGAINGSRTSPFKGKCRRIEEKRVNLPRPNYDKKRFTRAQWESLPKSLPARIIRYR